MKQIERQIKYWIFTLLELLIVIAIISILSALLLPSIAKVQEKTKSISCLNTERQLGVAIMGYAADNAGWCPTYVYLLSTPPLYWYVAIKSSMGDGNKSLTATTIAHCPKGTFYDDGRGYLSYAYNGQYSVFFNLSQLTIPSLSLCLIDSQMTTGAGYYFNDADKATKVYFCHLKSSNFLFLDNHVQSSKVLPVSSVVKFQQ